MKKYLYCLIVLLELASCSVSRKENGDFIAVYKVSGSGSLLPAYIILKDFIRTYDYFTPSIGRGEIGRLEIKGDTVILYPRYIYTETDGYETDSVAIPKKYLFRGGGLNSLGEDEYEFDYQKKPEFYRWK